MVHVLFTLQSGCRKVRKEALRRQGEGRDRMIVEISQRKEAAPLFEGWQESLIWSCLQNVMGKLYADAKENPTSAMILLGDFAFPAGEINRELILQGPKMYRQAVYRDGRAGEAAEVEDSRAGEEAEVEDSHKGEAAEVGDGHKGEAAKVGDGHKGEAAEAGDGYERKEEAIIDSSAKEQAAGEKGRMEGIIVPQNEAWADLIEESYGKKAKRVTRYAIKKEPGIFDKEKLLAVVDGLPDDYELRMIDEELFHRCGKIEWCRDWVSNYENYAMYQKYGLGAVLLKDGEPVSGAASYSGFLGGIEIEIDTREDYRRKGLAYICGAKLILECMARNWYPSWDAQNKWSVALAQKLGYHFDHEYPAYEIYT